MTTCKATIGTRARYTRNVLLQGVERTKMTPCKATFGIRARYTKNILLQGVERTENDALPKVRKSGMSLCKGTKTRKIVPI